MQTKRIHHPSQLRSKAHLPPNCATTADSCEAGARVRVIIVDDEPGVHRAIGYILEGSEEFQCVGSFYRGVEAVEGILTRPPDLVLMDIRLPDVSGIECTRRLARAMPRLKIVMISALDDRHTVDEALQAGCHNYLTKPFAAPQFLTILRCAMASRLPRHVGGERSCPLREATHTKSCGLIREREAQVLEAMSNGRYYKEIADDLNISQSMVHKLAHQAFLKLGVNSRHQAVAQWSFCSSCQHFVVRPSKYGSKTQLEKSA